MNALLINEAYFQLLVLPRLQEALQSKVERVAVGLVGEGSECYGFDDELSADHDYGLALRVWLTPEDFKDFGGELHSQLGMVPQEFENLRTIYTTPWGQTRSGVMTIPHFYKQFLGRPGAPKTIEEWERIPSSYLSVATNGKVFYDPLGEFSRIREELLAFYPEPVRLRKMADACMKIAQGGQYNYPRSVLRKEYGAAFLSATEAIKGMLAGVFLLNRVYQPFYKWAHRAVKDLPIMGAETHALIDQIVNAEWEARTDLIEQFAIGFVAAMKEQGLTLSDEPFLLPHVDFLNHLALENQRMEVANE